MNTVTEGLIDTSQCEKEPIHVPEAIQPHGMLLAVDDSNVIVRVSANAFSILGQPAEQLLQQPLQAVFEADFIVFIENALLKLIASGDATLTSCVMLHGKEFIISLYRSHAELVLELVPEQHAQLEFESKLSLLRHGINKLSDLPKLPDKLERITGLLQDVFMLDRVMLYRFDKDFNGEVIAESKRSDLQSYLGLHFPASDIPKQARELYLKNLVRVIPDVDYTPSMILTSSTHRLDMTHGSLRSVSPVHVQYLKNMGVQATVVCSLVIDDRLWGLIACHHYTPKVISHQLNELFRWMSLIVSNQIQVAEFERQQQQRAQFKAVNTQLMDLLRNGSHTLADLFDDKHGKLLLSVAHADGVAYLNQQQVKRYGSTPSEACIQGILQRLKSLLAAGESRLICTEKLPELLGVSADEIGHAAGLIALPVSQTENHVLMFFRNERVKTITWGGNPDKAMSLQNGQLSPRTSFEAWKTTVSDTAQPWLPVEVESAENFVAAIDLEIRNHIEAELQLLRSSVANLNDIIVITEAEPIEKPGPKIVYVNKAFEVFTGYSAEEVIGRSPRLLQGPKTSQKVLSKLRKCLKDWQKGSFELVNYRKDGTEYWTSIDISPVANAHGWYTHWTAIQRDITERKLAEETLRFIVQKGWISDRTEFLNHLLEHLALHLHADYLFIGKLQQHGKTMQCISFFGAEHSEDVLSFDMLGSPFAKLANKRYLSLPEGLQEKYADHTWLHQLQVQSLYAMPLISNHGHLIGTIAVLNRSPARNPALIESQLRLVSTRVESEIMRQESLEFIWHQANFDSLTDLPNRRMFQNRLDQEFKKMERSGQRLALLFLDLDNFKEINDNFGHDVGDLLLIEVAKRIQKCVRDVDTLARLGGDEFTVIMSALDELECVSRVSSAIIDEIAKPFELGCERLFVTISIGITIYPDDCSSSHALTKNADQAMYAAKESGRNCYRFFTPSMQQAAHHRMVISRELRTALQRNEFALYYQPIICLKTGKIHKAEALIRWDHPELGRVMPQEFISIAEDTGLINAMGDWVFRAAAEKADYLRKHGDLTFQISINNSPVQFRNDMAYFRSWLDYLSHLGVDGDAIVIEITESSFLDSSQLVQKNLEEFHRAGFKVAIDDFGTGYSSMGYLKKFDIDYLKIDRSFVANLKAGSDDMALCEAMIVMAHKLGMQVIAEGVETEEQKALLSYAGADFAQGYLFSPPIPFEAFFELYQAKT